MQKTGRTRNRHESRELFDKVKYVTTEFKSRSEGVEAIWQENC